jgi:hypothetical protein
VPVAEWVSVTEIVVEVRRVTADVEVVALVTEVEEVVATGLQAETGVPSSWEMTSCWLSR